MRKLFSYFLICLLLLSGCGAMSAADATEPAVQLQLGNPWKSYATLNEAENACGLDFPVPETIADTYTAAIFRVMNGSLLEVAYMNCESKITVRMQAASDSDISGVYETFQKIETTEVGGASVTEKQAENCRVYLIQKDGYTYSVYVSEPIDEEACQEILSHIC